VCGGKWKRKRIDQAVVSRAALRSLISSAMRAGSGAAPSRRYAAINSIVGESIASGQ
jgi:hypothetical protein